MPTATPTFTSTPLPTWTPRPTLPPAEAEALALDLLTNNAGCQLPCWWGFTPGQTTWQEAQSFLATFAVIHSASASGQVYKVYILFPEEIAQGAMIHNYTVKGGIIERIEIETGNLVNYRLPTFLSGNGPPTEVGVSTWPESYQGYLDFLLALFYPDQGILIKYDAPFSNVKGNQVEGCPRENLHSAAMVLWSPEQPVTFAEAIPWVDPAFHYLPLEEATGMNVETFYETFKDLENATCLKTPVELWSSPK